MTLNQIFYFIKAAELENFRTASLQLHISQPSLSRSMAMLEKSLAWHCSKRPDAGSG